ncbi:MAG: type III-B CRISPR module RAMP protein Cmr4 [Methylococcales bacterium]|nr:type III-B CRISPR module RAMP protein Cmr4 [Methylococcales bacterium]
MTATTALLGLLAQTSIHAGAGSQTGIIDLPIQREGHNGYPCVFGSAVKGALRDKAEQGIMAKLEGEKPKDAKSYADKIQADDAIVSVYGAPPKQAGDSAGAIIVTDARLLLFPVRSLTSQFKWVTCPDVLRRYKEDSLRLGLPVDFELSELNGIDENQAIVHSGVGSLFLEEYRFEIQTNDLSEIITALAQLMQRNDAKQALEKQLVIVSDDSFAHLVNHATPVNAHIALDSLTKTTTGGALWYEETLPPETLLYIGLSANASRQQDNTQSAQAILKLVLELFKNPYLQLGGNETVGMGWCIVKVLESK